MVFSIMDAQGRDRRDPPSAVVECRVSAAVAVAVSGTCNRAAADRIVIVIQSTSHHIIRIIYTSRLNLFSLGL